MTARRILGRLVALGCLAGLLATSGCGLAYGKREIVVDFTQQASPQQHRAARAACAAAAPHASPEPIVHTKFASTRVSDVRFRVDRASDADLAKLYRCLQRQPGVLGVTDPMDTTR